MSMRRAWYIWRGGDMTALPEDMSGRPRSELLRGALAALDLSGAMFLRGEFTRPWAIESSKGDALARSLEPGARRVILFHVVLAGRLVISTGGVDEELGPGDVAILPYADRHVMRSQDRARPVPIDALLPPKPWTRLPCLRHGGRGDLTSIACGYLYSADLHLSPILAALPPLLVVRTGRGGFTEWLLTNVRFAIAEADASDGGRDLLMQRLPELLLLKCLELHAREHGAGGTGWLAAAADPIVGHALAKLHRHPEVAWDLQRLARASSTSRSVLADRFHRLLGCAPMQYLTAWRLQLGARRLRATSQSVAEIASAIGYGSASSFSRAFKRHVGCSPAAWRDAR
jgi:AraC family transcriptional regulator, alkane utilization regulator